MYRGFPSAIQYNREVRPQSGSRTVDAQTVEKPRRRLLEQSSGECVQGVKTPCAFNQYGFSNFFKSLKIRPAWRKDFFDTLGRIKYPPGTGCIDRQPCI